MLCAFCGKEEEGSPGWVSIVLGPALWLSKGTKYLCEDCAKYARTALIISDGTVRDVLVDLADDSAFEEETDY